MAPPKSTPPRRFCRARANRLRGSGRDACGVAARRPTIVTTNYQDADIEKIRTADPLVRREYLVERIGQRLRSRLMEMCVVIPIDGTDWRRVTDRALVS